MGKQDELKTISTFLDEASEYGLEAEVIYSALKNMQEDSNLTPAQAMQFGMESWIK
jgi:hypothetical protein